jgi:hypothetical protein
MKKTRGFSEEQMIEILRDAEREPESGVAKRHGVSDVPTPLQRGPASLEPRQFTPVELNQQLSSTNDPETASSQVCNRPRNASSSPAPLVRPRCKCQ